MNIPVDALDTALPAYDPNLCEESDDVILQKVIFGRVWNSLLLDFINYPPFTRLFGNKTSWSTAPPLVKCISISNTLE